MTDTNTHPPQLPDTWIRTTVGTIYNVIGGGTPSTGRPEYWNGDIPWITSADILGLNDIRPRKSITQAGLENSATNLVPAGSLIVVTRVSLGKLALTETPLCFSQDSQALINTSNELNPKYALYFLSKAVEIFKYRNRGTTISGVTKKELRDLEFLLPPLPEQQRIVAKIEELFSDLDASVAALVQAQAQLRIYRQAVLKHAFDGRLTQRWREQQAPPPAAELLAQIQAERSARFQQQLAEWKVAVKGREAAGKPGRKPAKPREPEELAPLSAGELEELGELPEGWAWEKLGNVVDRLQIGPFGSQLHQGDYVTDGIPLINPKHIKEQRIVPENGVSISKEMYDELPQYVLRQNDVIMGRRGEMGRCAPVTQKEDGWFCGSGSLFVRLLSRFDAKLYSLVLSEARVRRFLENNSIGTTFQNLNSTILNNVPIPVIGFEEQQAIAAEVEGRLSVVDKLEETLAAALRQAEALRQSILKRAFAGKLVAQDPDDEPAQRLLERIRKAKAA